MKKAIVTTTINPPTKALKKFAEIAVLDGWDLIIVGDKKTPHAAYDEFEQQNEAVTYITPETQEFMSQELSDLIGWNCIQRRNFGFIAALKMGAEVIATVDDDNIPYPKWGKNVRLGAERGVSTYQIERPVFDPLSVTFPSLWHRGFPLEEIEHRKLDHPQQIKRKVLVQADMWDGNPDVDAICRIALDPNIRFKEGMLEFAGSVMGPFNSQNTFLHADLFPTYFLFPHIGRMDDIWAAYVTQHHFPDSVVYARASVVQDRNLHNLVTDLKAELIGYEHSLDVVKDPKAWMEFVPQQTIDAYTEWQKIINEIKNDKQTDKTNS